MDKYIDEEKDIYVALNKCYGGFGLSPKATELYLKKIGKEAHFYVQTAYKFKEGYEEYTKLSIEEATTYLGGACIYTLTKDLGKTFRGPIPNEHHWYETFYEDRSNKELIETITELGEEESSARLASISLVRIPKDMEYEIDDYDGIETLRENHRSW